MGSPSPVPVGRVVKNGDTAWASASSPRAAGATQAALAKTTSTMVREDPADSVLTFGLDDDDF